MVDGATAGADGRWATRPFDPAPFTTRFVVIRPRHPAAFNGVVVANWQNVTAGVDLGRPTGREIWRGYAWVGVTTQLVALTGRQGTIGLPVWDPERYGSLRHPGDPYSYSIFTAVARAVGRDRRRDPLDPLGGLDVTTVIATGPSQSASRLGAYIDGAHQHERCFDAFLPTVHWGVCPPPDSPPARHRRRRHRRYPADPRRPRRPILVVNSETEAWSMHPVRQPDTATYRFWEIAGGAHGGDDPPDERQRLLERDGIVLAGGLGEPTRPRTRSTGRSCSTPRCGGDRLGADGTPPSSFPPIEMTYGDPLTSIHRDEVGNALGGLRLPEIEVPVAVQRGVNDTPDMLLKLSGERRPLPADVLRDRDGDADGYLRRYREAVDRVIAADAVLAEDRAELIERVDGSRSRSSADRTTCGWTRRAFRPAGRADDSGWTGTVRRCCPLERRAAHASTSSAVSTCHGAGLPPRVGIAPRPARRPGQPRRRRQPGGRHERARPHCGPAADDGPSPRRRRPRRSDRRDEARETGHRGRDEPRPPGVDLRLSRRRGRRGRRRRRRPATPARRARRSPRRRPRRTATTRR